MVETGKRSPKEAARFRQRVKQVVIGKMTHGYRNYTKLTPKENREEGDMDTPHVSPRSIAEVSKREFETAVRKWRKFLHQYDDNPEADPEDDDEEGSSNAQDTVIEEHVTATPDMFPEEWIALLPEIFTSGKYVETRVKRKKPPANEPPANEEAASDDDGEGESKQAEAQPANPTKKRRSRNRRARQRLANALKAEQERELQMQESKQDGEEQQEEEEQQIERPDSLQSKSDHTHPDEQPRAASSSSEESSANVMPAKSSPAVQSEEAFSSEQNHLNPFATEFRARQKQNPSEDDLDFIRAHLQGGQCYRDHEYHWNHRSGHQAIYNHCQDRRDRVYAKAPCGPPAYSGAAWHHDRVHHGQGLHHGLSGYHDPQLGYACLPADHFKTCSEHASRPSHQTIAAYTRHLLKTYAVPPQTGYNPPPQPCYKGRRPCTGHVHLQDLSSGPGPNLGRDLLAFNSFLLSEQEAMGRNLAEGEGTIQHDACCEALGLSNPELPMHGTYSPTKEESEEENDGPPSLRDEDEVECMPAMCDGPGCTSANGVSATECEASGFDLDRFVDGVACRECDELISACTSMLNGAPFGAAAGRCDDCAKSDEVDSPLDCSASAHDVQDDALCRLCNFFNPGDQGTVVSTASVGITAEQSSGACDDDEFQQFQAPWNPRNYPRKPTCFTSFSRPTRAEVFRSCEPAPYPNTGDGLLADLEAFAKEFRLTEIP